MAQVTEEQYKRSDKKFNEELREKIRQPIIDRFEKEASPYYSSARLWDDGIIDPIDTRKVLGLSLQAALRNSGGETKFGVFRM